MNKKDKTDSLMMKVINSQRNSIACGDEHSSGSTINDDLIDGNRPFGNR